MGSVLAKETVKKKLIEFSIKVSTSPTHHPPPFRKKNWKMIYMPWKWILYDTGDMTVARWFALKLKPPIHKTMILAEEGSLTKNKFVYNKVIFRQLQSFKLVFFFQKKVMKNFTMPTALNRPNGIFH